MYMTVLVTMMQQNTVVNFSHLSCILTVFLACWNIQELNICLLEEYSELHRLQVNRPVQQ